MISKEKLQDFSPKFVAVGCKLEYDGKILLLRRNKLGTGYQQWGSCGGKVDDEENPEDAIAREIFEEASIKIDKKRLIHIGRYYVSYPEYDFVYHVYKYVLESEPTIILNPREHSEHKWLTPSEALKQDLMKDEDFCK